MSCPKLCCVESVSFLGMGSEAVIGNITIHPIAAKPSSPLRMRPAASEDFRRAKEGKALGNQIVTDGLAVTRPEPRMSALNDSMST
jgi:hypothetical protein